MNYLDLFHGIGGFAYGAYLASMKFENHLCSDIELYCQKLYKLRFPDSIQLGDITKIDTSELIKNYGTEWIITGGFPCQDISIAGKGAGITGSRSGLWFEYWRIIRDLRPRFAIMENVGAITFRGLTAVLGSLAEIGYNAEWQDIRASDVGAPHRRERIWIIAYLDSERFVCWESKKFSTEKRQQTQYEFNKCSIKINTNSNTKNVQRSKSESKNHRKSIRTISIPELWQKNRRPELLSTSALCRNNDGILNRVERTKGLGNAIVPQIAQLLFEQIKELL